MDLDLAGRVIFVAGGSRGIGLGIAEACLAEGARVALTARGAEQLERTREALAARYGADRVWAQAGDMRDTEAVETLVSAAESDFGQLWGAVANAGLSPCPPGFDIEDQVWSDAFSQNLDSAFRLTRTVLRGMTERRQGSVVHIGSIAGLGALGAPLAYSTSKAAMTHMTKELARIAGHSGVRVNMIAPGGIIFPGGGWDERMLGAEK